MRVALICNTTSAFPLLDWLKTQGALVGVAMLEQKSDFADDLKMVCQQQKITLQILKNDTLSQQLSTWIIDNQVDVVLVLGFSKKIPASLLNLPRFGFFNIHFGKLPKYGGSFPVFWQIKNQEKEGVLTIHRMDENYDTGPIAVEIPFEIKPTNTFGIVEANYSYKAINGVFQLLDSILKNNLVLKPQTAKKPHFLPKPMLKDLIIDWKTMQAEEIVALIRACNPWNRGAITRINGVDVKIIEAQSYPLDIKKAGTVFHLYKNGMEVSCIKNKALDIKIIYSQFGYLSGDSLGAFVIKNGDVFEQIKV
jgi:methionyl-tRNA formyltransferase